MHPRSRFITGTVTAAITFATLMAFNMPTWYNKTHDRACWHSNEKDTRHTDTTKTDF